MQQCDGVEDALGDPEFIDVQQVHAWRAPPDAFVTWQAFAGWAEASFHLAESVRSVYQALPVATFFQGKRTVALPMFSRLSQ